MKILFTHMYFWPDSPPYAAMLRTLATGMAEAGHDVHVFASKPSYRGRLDTAVPYEEVLDGVEIRRGMAIAASRPNKIVRLLNVSIYCLTLFIRILRLRPEVVTAATFPPVAAAWVASLAAKLCGAKFVYHMQDIHPEVSKYSGGLLGAGIAFRIMRVLDNQTLRRSSAIVVLSEDMSNTLKSRGQGTLPLHIINNLALSSESAVQPSQEYLKPRGKRRIIFAGNLGRFQNLSLLAEGVAECFEEHPEVELMFLGDGEMDKELKVKWGNHDQVTFAPFMPFSQAKSLIKEADIGLVSLAPNIYRVSYPSKMLTYLSLGVPLLTIVEPDSALAKDTIDNRLGEVPVELTVNSIRTAVEALLEDLDRKDAIAEWYASFSVAEIMKHWANIFESMDAAKKVKPL